MTKHFSTPAGAVLVAIDVSKHRQEVLIERPEGGRRRRLTVMATKQDYDHLAEQLAAIERPILVGFEATGNYHRTLAHRLLVAGFELRLISSVALARTREALHNGWDKNDPKDAQVILQMLRIGATQHYVDPLAAGINDLQELSKTHEAISKAKTQTWHRILTHYLPLYFPEIGRFAGNSRSDWFLALIERFPTPGSITALGSEAFSAEAWPLVGRKVSKARLINDIFETACTSIALPVPEDSAAITMFRMVIAQARSLIHQRDRIEQLAHATLAEHHDYQLLSACLAGTFSPSRRQIRSTRLSLTSQPARRSQLGDLAIAIAAILPGQLDEVGCQPLFIITALRDLTLCRTMLAERGTGATLGDGQLPSNVLDASAATRRAQKFPLAASCRISLSSVRSDTARRSRVFSVSRSFSRFT